jgi:NitT/TauT family transport system substrate-binding protein
MIRRRAAPSRFPAGNLILAALTAGAISLTAGADPPERIHLKVLHERYLSFAPIAIAQAEGYFRDQGLDVEWVILPGSSNETTPALIQGQLDVVVGMVRIGTFNAIARGAPLRVVADKGHFEEGPCIPSAFVARRAFVEAGSPDRPERLRGARVAARPLGFPEYLLEILLGRMGLALTDLKLIRIPEVMVGEAIFNDSLDAGQLAEPDLTRALKSGRAVVWKSIQEISPGAQLAAVTFGPNLLERNREAGRRFMVAYLQGVRQYNRGKTVRNVAAISKETGLDPELVRETCWQPIRADGTINVESVLDFQRWAVRRGALDAVVPTEKFWDPSFVEEAVKVLGPPKP